MMFADFSTLQLPLSGTTITPGKPIRFDDNVILGFNPILMLPFSHTTPSPAPMSESTTSATTPLTLDYTLPAHPAAGKDLTITYLIGNSGDKPVWVAQNQLVAALTSWQVRAEGKLVAIIPASDLAATVAMLPERLPAPLYPGEFLTWRRTLPAAAMPLKAGQTYDLSLRLDVPWWAAEPAAGDEPKHLDLSASDSLRIE